MAWCWGSGVQSDLQYAFREGRSAVEAVYISGETIKARGMKEDDYKLYF